MNDIREFQERLSEHTKAAEEIVLRYLVSVTGSADAIPDRKDVLMHLSVAEAMNYSLESGGKRLRPMLMQLTFELFHGTNVQILHPFMAAIEMIHTYSLVHDDLPAMDNDLLRRGNKTTHAAYGEATAILAGDGLLNLAFETALLASEHCADAGELMRIVLALRILAAKSGIRGMVAGQCIDLASEQGVRPADAEKTLYFIHENKTAALIEAAFMCGAILAGAPATSVDRMEEAGSRIGHVFQIRDDILDVTGNTATLGKTAGKDENSGKLTYVSLRGLDQAKEDMEDETEKAVQTLKEAGAREEDFIVQLIRYLTYRDH